MKYLIDLTLDISYDNTLSLLRNSKKNGFYIICGVYNIPVECLKTNITFNTTNGKKAKIYGIIFDDVTERVDVKPVLEVLRLVNLTQTIVSTLYCNERKEEVFVALYKKYFETIITKGKMLNLDKLSYKLVAINKTNKTEYIRAPKDINNLEKFLNIVCTIDVSGTILNIPFFLYYMLYQVTRNEEYNRKIILRPKTKLAISPSGNILGIGFEERI